MTIPVNNSENLVLSALYVDNTFFVDSNIKTNGYMKWELTLKPSFIDYVRVSSRDDCRAKNVADSYLKCHMPRNLYLKLNLTMHLKISKHRGKGSPWHLRGVWFLERVLSFVMWIAVSRRRSVVIREHVPKRPENWKKKCIFLKKTYDIMLWTMSTPSAIKIRTKILNELQNLTEDVNQSTVWVQLTGRCCVRIRSHSFVPVHFCSKLISDERVQFG
jgi:hypothetical protein